MNKKHIPSIAALTEEYNRFLDNLGIPEAHQGSADEVAAMHEELGLTKGQVAYLYDYIERWDVALKADDGARRRQALDTAYVTKLECYNTGGGCMVDTITLEDGQVVGISDDCVALYRDMDAFWNNTADDVIGHIDR